MERRTRAGCYRAARSVPPKQPTAPNVGTRIAGCSPVSDFARALSCLGLRYPASNNFTVHRVDCTGGVNDTPWSWC